MRRPLLHILFFLLLVGSTPISTIHAAACGSLPEGCPVGYSCVTRDGSPSCVLNESGGASSGFVPLAPSSDSKLETLYSSEGTLAQFFNRIFTLALTIGGILAVFRIAWAGYLYMTTDLWSSKERAKETLRETVLGLLLLIAVYVILKQINPNILNLDVLQKIEDNPAPKTSAQLQQEHLGDTTTNPTEYMPSLSFIPLVGYYCFPKELSGGSGFSCVTNETTCQQLATSEGKACTKY